MNYHHHPVVQFKAPKQPSSLKLDIKAETFDAGLEETNQTLRNKLQEALALLSNDAYSKDGVFDVQDMVWLSMWHFQTTRGFKKLDCKPTGPDTVRMVININGFKLDVP